MNHSRGRHLLVPDSPLFSLWLPYRQDPP